MAPPAWRGLCPYELISPGPVLPLFTVMALVQISGPSCSVSCSTLSMSCPIPCFGSFQPPHHRLGRVCTFSLARDLWDWPGVPCEVLALSQGHSWFASSHIFSLVSYFPHRHNMYLVSWAFLGFGARHVVWCCSYWSTSSVLLLSPAPLLLRSQQILPPLLLITWLSSQ